MLRDVLTPVFVVLIVIALLVAFISREPDTDISGDAGYYRSVCIEGVEYYLTGYKLAPAVDAETLTFIRCEVK